MRNKCVGHKNIKKLEPVGSSIVSKRDLAMQIRETNLRDPSEIPIVQEGE